jgi:hypothetical protein
MLAPESSGNVYNRYTPMCARIQTLLLCLVLCLVFSSNTKRYMHQSRQTLKADSDNENEDFGSTEPNENQNENEDENEDNNNENENQIVKFDQQGKGNALAKFRYFTTH